MCKLFIGFEHESNTGGKNLVTKNMQSPAIFKPKNQIFLWEETQKGMPLLILLNHLSLILAMSPLTVLAETQND